VVTLKVWGAREEPFSVCQTGELGAAASALPVLRARRSEQCLEPRAVLGGALQTGRVEGGQ